MRIAVTAAQPRKSPLSLSNQSHQERPCDDQSTEYQMDCSLYTPPTYTVMGEAKLPRLIAAFPLAATTTPPSCAASTVGQPVTKPFHEPGRCQGLSTPSVAPFTPLSRTDSLDSNDSGTSTLGRSLPQVIPRRTASSRGSWGSMMLRSSSWADLVHMEEDTSDDEQEDGDDGEDRHVKQVADEVSLTSDDDADDLEDGEGAADQELFHIELAHIEERGRCKSVA
uniref:Uncharacterized protein n=1 Tax=Haptolina brevifila TaxID=156173 RepID=A0A7S2DK49_9EUKA|mmetsp:Transcript_39981/g.80107  ORF Transcript_39981/g.80107 Transcript_39981/m.80107 type:complete len:224 (+) Transcript_39981:83-754(+)